jgi:hypothetical protein
MDDSLYFNEQHIAVREMVRAFATDEIAPIAARADADAAFPWETVKKMGELGLLGVPWPEDLGGAGLDILSYMIVINELAKVDASHAITVSAHTTLGTSPIVNFGTDAQRRRFVGVRSHRAWGWARRGGDAHDRRPPGQSLRRQRLQDLYHPRGRRRDLRRHRRHRPRRRDERHQLVHPDQGNRGPGPRPELGRRP